QSYKPMTDQGRQHANHSILWGLNSNDLTKMTCDRAGTIEDSLKRSAQFRKITGKNKDKELVIIRNNRAISKHFPCTLINKEDRLTVKFVKAVELPKKPVGAYVSLCKNKPASELVSFHVVTKGGKDIVKILNNRALRAVADEITIYAYKGEKVKHALKRDGRLLSTIFKKNFVLLNRSTQVKTELSNIVDELNDETFQITLLDKSRPPQSLSGSLDEAYLLTNENQSQSESENDNTIKQECNDNITSGNELQEIPNSKSMKSQLCSRFEESVRALKSLAPNPSHIQNLLRVNFGQSAQMCREVKAMKKLMGLSDSVCQVRINGVPNGTGFLLFGRYVLTNGHIIQDIYDEKRCKLISKVSVHFSYDSVEQTDGALDVVEVVGIDCSPEVPGGDWALLKLRDNQKLATALLKHSGFLPSDSGICIIGHPDGGVKKIDPCLIVPSHSRIQVANRHHRENLEHVQLISNGFFLSVAKSIHQKSFLTYESCFYHSSSGSPVFDKHSDVVAVHSGGYIYESARGEIQTDIATHLEQELYKNCRTYNLKL
uniref:Serine protease n=1 Tax=Cyprinodon variegatus TaxID=28743 RepID=A0A3Q2CZG2_CYPVA